MRNRTAWQHTKFEPRSDGGLRASRDPREVSISSRLVADNVAGFYSRSIPTHVSGHVLDLGCGKAPLLGLYEQFGESTTLVDWGNSLHENPHLDAIADLNEPLQLESDHYGAVLLSDVLEHIRRPDALMAEIARVLRPGGALLMNTPFLYWVHEQPHDFFRYTEFALADIVRSAGLEVVELTRIGGAVEVIADMVSKLVVHVPLVGPPVAALLQSAAQVFLSSRLGSLVARRTGAVAPLGYALVARKPG